MDNLQQMAAMTALNQMMEKGWMDICTIDSIAKMLGINCDGMPAHRMLRTLHCVHFNKMPQDLQKAIPGLIKECLSIEPVYQFSLPKPEPVVVYEQEKQPEQKRGLLRLLSR